MDKVIYQIHLLLLGIWPSRCFKIVVISEGEWDLAEVSTGSFG
jgi:hypothetical protein